MHTFLDRRVPLFLAGMAIVVALAVGFFVALGIRSVVAGPDFAPQAAPPNPGHSWSEVGDLPGTMWHSNNDGAGSGLDGDMVDGLHAADLLAASTVPSGAIILWDGGACPPGYARLASYDDKFLVGSGTAGTVGGSDTHTHGVGSYAGSSHTHIFATDPTGGTIFGSRKVGVTGGYSGSDTGTGKTLPALKDRTLEGDTGAITGISESADNIPAFKTILLCKKD